MLTDFTFDKSNNRAIYTETLKFKDGNHRLHLHKMDMPHHEILIDIIRSANFDLIGRMSMNRVGRPNEFLVVFRKDE